VDHPPRARPLTPLSIPAGLDATLVLVRHGESQLIAERRFQGRLETPLSTLGRRQAELVARRLAHPHSRPALPIPAHQPLAIVHSPLARAAETAAAIAAAIDDRPGSADGADVDGRRVAVRADDRFMEIGQGEWEGRLASEITETDGDRLAAWRTRPTETWAPGGEPLADVRTRVASGLADLLDELATAGRPGSILAPQVAGYRHESADQPWLVLVAHDGVFKVTLLTLFDLPLERFWMWTTELCGISIVELRAGRPAVRAMNLTEHLAPLLDEDAQATTEERQRSGAL
jgi:broad specificity phosphatase PhoE